MLIWLFGGHAEPGCIWCQMWCSRMNTDLAENNVLQSGVLSWQCVYIYWLCQQCYLYGIIGSLLALNVKHPRFDPQPGQSTLLQYYYLNNDVNICSVVLVHTAHAATPHLSILQKVLLSR